MVYLDVFRWVGQVEPMRVPPWFITRVGGAAATLNTEHSGPRTKTIWAIERKKLNQLESTYIYIYIIGQEKYN